MQNEKSNHGKKVKHNLQKRKLISQKIKQQNLQKKLIIFPKLKQEPTVLKFNSHKEKIIRPERKPVNSKVKLMYRKRKKIKLGLRKIKLILGETE